MDIKITMRRPVRGERGIRVDINGEMLKFFIVNKKKGRVVTIPMNNHLLTLQVNPE